MHSNQENPGAPRRKPEREYAISPAQAARFVLALREGATVAEAAEVAGVAVTTLYYRRKRDADFASCWREGAALGRAAEAEAWRVKRAEAEAASARGTVVRGHAGVQLMRKRKLPVEFDRERKQVFLDHFAATCNLEESAGEAGISLSPVYRALQSDPAFLAGFEEALRLGYLCMEAEALREQREAQQAYLIEPADSAARARSFERTMALLQHHRATVLGKAARRGGPRATRWTFEAAIDAIEEGLRSFGVEIPGLPPPEGEAGPAEGESGDA